ncbi:MAG TPA: hypothetical protein VJR89_16410 [Polyangiales bacterium]|nr:hypothetical protein [Polyangiales bacterium]
MQLAIERDWSGSPLPATEAAWLAFERCDDQLEVRFDAPYFADPPPPWASGPTPGLWEYEVIELFLASAGDEYFELELGPHGHHLALQLRGVRNVVRSALPIVYSATIQGGRYAGRAQVPLSYLPDQPVRVNAYLIHGSGSARSYAAHAPVPGAKPDFHRLECFVPLCW